MGQRNILGSGCAGDAVLANPAKAAAVSEQILKTSRIEPLEAQARTDKVTSREQFSPSFGKGSVNAPGPADRVALFLSAMVELSRLDWLCPKIGYRR